MDRREALMSRLLEVVRVPGIKKVARNKTDVSGRDRPAVIVLDADEVVDPHSYDRGRPAAAPLIVMLSPEVYVSVEKLASTAADEDVLGPMLNSFRMALLRAVLADTVFPELVGRNGEVRYDGCVTDFARGRSMEGELIMNFSFRYVLSPTDYT
jgi:hypothetical protein